MSGQPDDLQVVTNIPELRDRKVERFIATVIEGVGSVQLVNLPIADIDIKKSLLNQARAAKPIEPELVASYRRQLELRAEFPPIICNSKGMVADGNHRVAAFEAAGRSYIPSYIVDVNHQQFKELAYAANSTNGRGNTEEEQRLHVLELYATGAYSYQVVADRLGLSPSYVMAVVNADSARVRLSKFRRVGDTAVKTLHYLNQIGNDEHLVAAYDVAHENNMSGEDVRKMVGAIKSSRTNTAVLDAISEAGNAARAKRAPKSRPKQTSDLSQFKRGVNILAKINAASLALSANGSTDEVVADVQRCIAALAEIEKAATK